MIVSRCLYCRSRRVYKDGEIKVSESSCRFTDENYKCKDCNRAGALVFYFNGKECKEVEENMAEKTKTVKVKKEVKTPKAPKINPEIEKKSKGALAILDLIKKELKYDDVEAGKAIRYAGHLNSNPKQLEQLLARAKKSE